MDSEIFYDKRRFTAAFCFEKGRYSIEKDLFLFLFSQMCIQIRDKIAYITFA